MDRFTRLCQRWGVGLVDDSPKQRLFSSLRVLPVLPDRRVAWSAPIGNDGGAGRLGAFRCRRPMRDDGACMQDVGINIRLVKK
jgi:hypothetical protein